MQRIEDLIIWKNYARNRLLELLRRAGAEVVFREMDYPSGSKSIARAMMQLDKMQRAFFNSIEKYALGLPEEDHLFTVAAYPAIPVDKGPEAFCGVLHDNYLKALEFIQNLEPGILDTEIDHPVLKSRITTGWLIQYITHNEATITGEIKASLHYNNLKINVPWAISSYNREPRRLVLK